MIEIGFAEEYTAELAEAMGRLRQQLSARHDGSALSREQIEEILESPWHAIMLATDGDEIIGMAILSIVFASIDRNVYLEDFVIDKEHRGQGIGRQMWQKMLEWGRSKGCKRMEFTSSKAGALDYYKKMGAEKRETNCYRVELQ